MNPSPNTAIVLQAWMLPSSIRHQVIFDVLDALPPGHSVTLINDHDPKPLFYQLDAEQPDQFRRQATTPPNPALFSVVVTRQSSPDHLPMA